MTDSFAFLGRTRKQRDHIKPIVRRRFKVLLEVGFDEIKFESNNHANLKFRALPTRSPVRLKFSRIHSFSVLQYLAT